MWGSIGELPDLSARICPCYVGGPVAQTKLREHVAHLVLDVLAGDVEPIAYLSVGQPGADQLERLDLALCQRAETLGPGADGGRRANGAARWPRRRAERP